MKYILLILVVVLLVVFFAPSNENIYFRHDDTNLFQRELDFKSNKYHKYKYGDILFVPKIENVMVDSDNGAIERYKIFFLLYGDKPNIKIKIYETQIGNRNIVKNKIYNLILGDNGLFTANVPLENNDTLYSLSDILDFLENDTLNIGIVVDRNNGTRKYINFKMKKRIFKMKKFLEKWLSV